MPAFSLHKHDLIAKNYLGRWASLNDMVRTKTTGLHVPPRMRDGEDRRLDNRDRWIKQSIEVGNITGNRI